MLFSSPAFNFLPSTGCLLKTQLGVDLSNCTNEKTPALPHQKSNRLIQDDNIQPRSPLAGLECTKSSSSTMFLH